MGISNNERLKLLMLYEYDRHSKRAAEWHLSASRYRNTKTLKTASSCQHHAAYWSLRAFEARDIYIELTKGIEVEIIG